MSLQRSFSQNQLIGATGFQYPAGVCLGLVVQWLISISKTLSDESTFWSDLDGSLANAPSTPLLGKGYARKAIEFQGEYNNHFIEYLSTGQYTRGQLSEAGLSLKDGHSGAQSAFSGTPLDKIVQTVLNSDCRYFILGLRGTLGGHAIGIYRSYSLVGKSTSVQIFDPNIGKYSCSGETALRTDLGAVSTYYNGELHAAYTLEGYKA